MYTVLFLLTLQVHNVRTGCKAPNSPLQLNMTATPYTVLDYDDSRKPNYTVSWAADLADNVTITAGYDVPAGKQILVSCLTGYIFVNGVRKTKGVNVFNIDQSMGIVMTCKDSGNWDPAIDKNLLGMDRYLYCDEGCVPFREDRRTVQYPPSTVTSEEGSPPLVFDNNSYITLACQAGYTRASGDVGKTEVQCKKDDNNKIAWSIEDKDLIQCVKGCPDITKSVTNGETTDTPNSNTDGGYPPFKPGDTVTFSCSTGYTLVGYHTLTCTGLLKWNENLPQCVYIA